MIKWMRSVALCAIASLSVLFCSSAFAQGADWGTEYARRVKSTQMVSPLTDESFGDKVNLYNGTVSFSATDISLPGNSALPVALSRSYNPQDVVLQHHFGKWDIDIPHISTVRAINDNAGWRFNPGSVSNGNITFDSDTYWDGNQLSLPDGGGDLLSVPADPKRVMPANGVTNSYGTKSGWFFSLIPSLPNGQAGKGLIGYAPDGSKYYFDKLVERDYSTISHPWGYTMPGSTLLYRKQLLLYVTMIEDRFGNWVKYEWTGNQPTRIHANDGREITLAYSTETYPQLTSATAAGRTWIYNNAAGTVTNPDGSQWVYAYQGHRLDVVPYKRQLAHPYPRIGHTALPCSPGYLIEPSIGVYTVTHPSGAKAEFKFSPMRHGRTQVPFDCMTSPAGEESRTGRNAYSTYHDVWSVTAKQISGPGLATATQIYAYTSLGEGYTPQNESNWWIGPGWNAQYAPAGPNTKTVTVTDADGTQNIHTFGKDMGSTEGQLLKVETRKSGITYKTVTNTYMTYAQSLTAAFPASMGLNGTFYGDNLPNANRPVMSTVVAQDGAQFVTMHSGVDFDRMARPTKTSKWSELGAPGEISYAKTDVTEYNDHLGKWVVGQVSRNTTNGIETSRTVFDATTALPLQSYSFGKLQQTLTYNADGTVATVKDGNNNVITLSGWKRGIPQKIKHPATPEYPTGAEQTAGVNDAGWINWVEDENRSGGISGNRTCYGYDAMGRIKLITYPSETTAGVCDASVWTPTTLTFEPIAVAEYNIPAGHWRQTVMTGSGRKLVYFDAMWRPLVVREDDTSQITATRRVTRNEYDHDGRVTFTSYPVADGIPPAVGIWTEFDALGRPTSVSQNSEHTSAGNPSGLLTTLTEYLPGFQTRVTNPKGQQTLTTMYQAYDQPTYDWPRGINHPEGAYTEIYRDVFGKPTAVKRRNSTSSIAITRSYAYNGYQELCRSAEPETGATLMGYDGAGNLTWSASGLSPAAAPGCHSTGDQVAINPRKAVRAYDARNRVKTLSFPDGVGNQTWAYAPDGLPTRLFTYNTNGGTTVANEYTYNKRRLLAIERLITADLNWPLTYAYNANGHLSAQIWHGLNIDYAPNALGQPTKAGTYASGVSYYPNGAIKQFTYGNGIVHTMTQNVRQLPSRSTDSVTGSKPLDLGYVYDKNSNVSGITDYVTGGRQTRGMTYDNLDRLTQTTSSMFGTATYGYNVLDNLTTVIVASGNKARNHTYTYDANNRLANVKNTVGGATVVGLGYDVQGNLANKNGVLYDFDFGNRLRMVTDTPAGKTSTYIYDGLGRRVRDTVNGVSKHSHYLQNGQLSMVGDSRTNKVSEYVYLGGSLLAIRDRDVTTNAYTTKYQHTDALGTPIATTSQSRTLLETSEYEPFGQQVNVVGAPKDGPGYTGHVQDAATGLTYMQQRYYDPGIGRFLSVDPVTANSGTGANFNRYWYANNNPYSFTDPDGRCGTHIEGRASINCTSISVNSSGSGSGGTGSGSRSGSQGSGRRWDGQISTTPGGGLKGAVGDKIKGFLDSKFETDLFDRYWYGDGDYQLSTSEFNGAVSATFGLKPEQRQMIAVGGVNYVAAKYSFYGGTFAGAFGQAWLISNSKGGFVGFYDRYDFNSKAWSERWPQDHFKTWAAGSAGAIFGARAYEITYGIYTELP